ncbi:MAG: 4-hydroxythreonine-4-phosphate dehydrogenase PdxA [Candidatus Omnitrophota bacterium]
MKLNKIVLCLTMGYPAGIGPEILVSALASPAIRKLANFLIIGDAFVFEKACRIIKKKIDYKIVTTDEQIDFLLNSVLFYDLGNVEKRGFSFGKIDKSYGKASIEYIAKAVNLIQTKKAHNLVTAPINKFAAKESGFKYPGHTEYLTALTHTKDYAMMLAGGPLRVVLATIHIPLKNVPTQLSKEKILQLIILTNNSLKKQFKIRKPKIAVCALNPHAGENGLMGSEDKNIIAPAVESAKAHRIKVEGPYPADAIFYDAYKGKYDAVICMYHDQGLVPLKMIARDTSVNITLGLPFIRTSPGHGTALDIAGKGTASADSMKQAIKAAVPV